MYGDGSLGALSVGSGVFHPLALNTKHQFTSVDVLAGGYIYTASTSGAVLYITATSYINIAGTIDMSGRVINGDNTWSVTIDGITYTSPGVEPGGAGKRGLSNTSGLQYAGFGGGGAGYPGGAQPGGAGGDATGSDPDGGNNVTITRNIVGASGSTMGGYAGGGGAGGARVNIVSLSGGASFTGVSTSGEGGESFGENGGSGTTGYSWNGIGSVSYTLDAGGGGGAGGRAGKAGVHVVLIAPQIILGGTSVINTSGVSGGVGGSGGESRTNTGPTGNYGYPGGGGGGGNAGNIYVKYATSLTNSGSKLYAGGAGGSGGVGGAGNTVTGFNGDTGEDGNFISSTLLPQAEYSVVSQTVTRGNSFALTNRSIGATSYAWNFGDGNTSTATNPTHTYTTVGVRPVSLTATNAQGSHVYSLDITAVAGVLTRSADASMTMSSTSSEVMYARRSVSASMTMGSTAYFIVIKDTGSLGSKKYLYKVYDEDGNFITVWNDVTDDLEFTQEINSLGSETTVVLARNSDSLAQASEPLQAETGLTLETESSIGLTATIASRTQVGEGSSVLHNNRVDVYTYYGAIESLQTESGEPITTEDGEELQTEVGYPNGVRIFTGFISDINVRYGNEESTVVTLSSYGYDLQQFPLMEAGNTTVAYNSYDPSDIAKSVVDKFTAEVVDYELYTTRTVVSIDTTGTEVSYTFKNNNYAEALDKILELMPSNWYYYVGLGDNTVYYRERSDFAQHLFYLGKHIVSLDLKSSTKNTTNDVIFTGGGDPALFRRYTAERIPRTRRTLERYSDNRVTLESSAEIISEGMIERSNRINYRSTLEIASGVYDIESIKVGDTIGFRNFDNEVDLLVMQVVGLHYSSDLVQLQLDTLPPTVNKRLEDIRRNLKVTENENVPDAPVEA